MTADQIDPVPLRQVGVERRRVEIDGQQSWEELRRVVWPTRKETLNTTGLVMAFVVIIAFFLFICDKLIEWGLYDVLLRISI